MKPTDNGRVKIPLNPGGVEFDPSGVKEKAEGDVLVRRFHLRLMIFMPFGHGDLAPRAQVSAYGRIGRGFAEPGRTSPCGKLQKMKVHPGMLMKRQVSGIGCWVSGAAPSIAGCRPRMRGPGTICATLAKKHVKNEGSSGDVIENKERQNSGIGCWVSGTAPSIGWRVPGT